MHVPCLLGNILIILSTNLSHFGSSSCIFPCILFEAALPQGPVFLAPFPDLLYLVSPNLGSSESSTYFPPQRSLLRAMPNPLFLLLRMGRSAEIARRPLVPKPSADGMMARSTSQSNFFQFFSTPGDTSHSELT